MKIFEEKWALYLQPSQALFKNNDKMQEILVQNKNDTLSPRINKQSLNIFV